MVPPKSEEAEAFIHGGLFAPEGYLKGVNPSVFPGQDRVDWRSPSEASLCRIDERPKPGKPHTGIPEALLYS